MTSKYIKPLSLTWWSIGIAPLAAGIFLLLEPIHELHQWIAVIRGFTDLTPQELILFGLGGIGLRGAIK